MYFLLNKIYEKIYPRDDIHMSFFPQEFLIQQTYWKKNNPLISELSEKAHMTGIQ